MKPPVPDVMVVARAEIDRELAGELPDSTRTLLRRLGIVVDVIAQQWDRAAQDRLEHIAQLRRLLHDGAGLATAALRERLVAASAEPPPSDVSISALDARIESLYECVIAVQGECEASVDPQVVALDRELAAVLHAAVRRTAVDRQIW